MFGGAGDVEPGEPGGNGGAKPRHAELLAVDIDEETALRYIDRFLMYYISTADRLTRTSVWCEKLEGGIDHLREVVVDDKLGICADLESMLQRLVDAYECEWAAVVRDPEKRKRFRQFANTDETESCIEFVSERGQCRPADWTNELVSLETYSDLTEKQRKISSNGGAELLTQTRWVTVGRVDDFPRDGGATIKYGKTQIAVFHFASRGQWYASQNMCPHKRAFVLSRGIIGTAGETPKVACPLHKKTFSLESGSCLSGEDYSLKVFPVQIRGDKVHLLLPPKDQLNALLATELHCRHSADAGELTCSS